MPNLSATDYKKMSTNDTFQVYECDDVKLICRLNMDAEETYFDRRVFAKIHKLDRNSQYDYALTKPPFLKEKASSFTK